MSTLRFLAVMLLLCAGLLACPASSVRAEGEGKPDTPPTPPAAPAAPEIKPDDRFLIGTYELVEVVDGDTVKVTMNGKKVSLRLTCLDTEEKESFTAQGSGESGLPEKRGTKAGESAKHYAKKLLEGVKRVRLESESPRAESDAAPLDTYNRVLCYLFVLYDDHADEAQRAKAPELYNLRCIRDGMSPYFTKYGRSKRFDAAFVAAQEEAQRGKKGVFGELEGRYEDYDQRLAWWDRRAAALAKQEGAEAKDPKAAPVRLGEMSVYKVLDDMIAAAKGATPTVTVFGLVDDHVAKAVAEVDGGRVLLVGSKKDFVEVLVPKALLPEVEKAWLARMSADLTTMQKGLKARMGDWKAAPFAPDAAHMYRGDFVRVTGTLARDGRPLSEYGLKSKRPCLRVTLTQAGGIRMGDAD